MATASQLTQAFDLPSGNVAVLVDDYKQESDVLIPESSIQFHERLDTPPHRLLEGVVLKSTDDAYEPGDHVLVRINAGLVIWPDDLDVPHLGKFVPKGKSLRFYGRGVDPCIQAILKRI